MEDPTSKGDESSKKVPTTSSSSSGRRGKEVTVNTVNTTQQVPQQYSMNYTAGPPTAPSYAPQAPQYRPQASTQPIYYSALPPPPPSAAPSPVVHHYAPTPSQAPQYQPPVPRASQSTQRVPPLQSQQGGAAQPRPRRQYPALPVPLSHIYRQIRDKIGTIAPGPSFDPTIQDQSKQCEYHQGAPGHTLDTCWRLRESIQEMIDAKELVFNAVRLPNVQANPLPDHGSAPGPSINMITVCTSSEGEGEQDGPSPVVIEYVPVEVAVGFAGVDAPHAPLVIDVPAREPYSTDRIPWTYEGSVGNLERQFGVMGITRSRRLYENPTTTDKGKAPVAEEETRPRTLPTPSKKLGRMEDPTSKGDESSKKVPATSSSSSGRRGKEVTVNTVNTAQQVPQQYSMNYTAAPPTAPSYAPQRLNIGLKPLPNQSTIPHYHLHPHLRRRSLSSTIMHLLRPKPLNTNLLFLGLLSRHNESRPRKVNKAVQHNRDPADNTRPCRFRFPTSTGKFAIRSGQ
ncbi:altered inheritance of mitochondria protein 3-like [Punica granatum]|uniref:Altered inheritance of mitochondria protein 3-like n=1 Tax=Punica granatum TaxID=22663 RepID=A0A6P8D0K3_PUNGR|nr:altered inheritance of mitochondria protein 3-like [Punica granatum]